MNKTFLLLLLLNAVAAKSSDKSSRKSGKKQVRFASDSLSSDYLSFGDETKHKAGSTPIQKKQPLPGSNNVKPLKSALKNSSLTNSTGVFGLSPEEKQQHFAANQTLNKAMNAMNVDSFSSSSFANQGPPPGQILNDSSAPIYYNDSFRNVGPTPQILYDLSPERFWLPPNAPMQTKIDGPWLPYSFGVPGGPPNFGNDLPVYDAYSPQVTGLTGPRDPFIPADPRSALSEALESGVATIGNYQPPYQPPCIIPPLKPVTPIPGGNITDPLSPTVTNVRGPFFPDDPLDDHAFLFQQPDIDEGFYEVERVVDPIVFFDPNGAQTVLFDPIQNTTRPFDPEIDPELPFDEELDGGSGNNNGNMLKSANSRGLRSIDKPAFWILKNLGARNNSGNHQNEYMRQYEKAAINGQPQSGRGNGFAQLNYNQNLQKSHTLQKKPHISYKMKANHLHKADQKPSESNLKIQIASDSNEKRISVSTPNSSVNPNMNNSSASVPKSNPSSVGQPNNTIKPRAPIQKSAPIDVKKQQTPSSSNNIPRRPRFDPEIREKTFQGFKSKAHGNSASTVATSPTILTFAIATVFAYFMML